MSSKRADRTLRIDLAHQPEFQIGGATVKPAELAVELRGQRHELQPRIMKVLVALANGRPSVVSRDRLIEQCWDGRVVGDDALNRCILALRHLAQRLDPDGFVIETVPRIGHRLIEQGGDATAPAIQSAASLLRPRPLITAILMLAVAALALVIWRNEEARAAPTSIAVLPFRNMSSGDPYFAEGVGEEILASLSREPEFRVAGSASSSQLPKNLELDQVARRLNVEYILEGSVRRQGDRVRVTATLVRASDGSHLWADSYDGNLDNIFAIQQRVGSSVAGALKRKLVRTPTPTGPLVTTGEAYSLYLSARTLVKTSNRRVGATAVDLLRDATRLDPGYAPAWATLADATRLAGGLHGHDSLAEATREARQYAARAVQLAPNLAEAHRALANTFEAGDPRRFAHSLRAAALDPNNAENLHALGDSLQAEGRFGEALEAYERARSLDPLWYRTVGQLAITVAEMGDRAKAEAIGRRGFLGNEIQQHVLLGRVAWIFGDFSEAARRWSIVARSNSPRWRHTAERTLRDATHSVGIEAGPLERVPRHWRVWLESPPPPSVWKARNRDAIYADVYGDLNLLAAKLMLNAGRASELSATYDSPIGLLGVRRGEPPRVTQLTQLPIVAIALRESGRPSEAAKLLREAEALRRRVYSGGKVPFRFDATAAELFAVANKRDKAIAALRRAFARGWRHGNGADLRDIAAEPALRSLHGHPQFERLRSQLAAHYAKEREEVLRLRL